MRMLRFADSLLFLMVTLLAIGIPGIALAQEDEEEPQIHDMLILQTDFPTVESIAGGEFEYEIECIYIGSELQKNFDLRAKAPQGWQVYITPRYETEKRISSINLQPSLGTGETIIVVATAPFYPLPNPGEYKITIEAVSDTVETSVELTARITAIYQLLLVPTLERYDTEVEAGKDNYYSMEIGNLSTAEVENIKFSSIKPEGWAIEFNPENIEKLEAIGDKLDRQTIEINVKPPKGTIAGDYYITVSAIGKQTSTDEVDIRITVKTAPTWQWIGVGIIVIVVAAVIAIFMRFSRR